MTLHKLIFTGSVGAGKTTAISAISDNPPINTDVRSHDSSFSKPLTTVALDYGELTLDNGDTLRLYGTPGQARFNFMWEILAKGALGLVILIDNTRPDPLSDLDEYLTGFADLIDETGCVVAVGRMESHPYPDIGQFAERLASRGVLCPVLPVDVRRREEVLQLLDLLLTQLEDRIDCGTRYE